MLDDESGRRWSTTGGMRPAFMGDRTHVWLAPDVRENGSAGGSNGHSRREDGVRQVQSPDANGAETVGAAPVPRNALRGLRVLIVDDCTLYRENLVAAFRTNGAADLGIAWDLPSLMIALKATQPDILLLNIATHDSALLLRAAPGMYPGARMIVLGVSEDDESQIVACAEAGVAGYHMRTDSLDDLLVTVRQVAAGETSCSPSLASMLLRRLTALASQRQPVAKELALTGREAQILQMLELGLSNHDIAVQLSIAVHTVKNHVHSLLKKLGVGTRAEAAALSRAIRHRQE
jgi:DNA-binding NarL/FixJ family response regulator